MKNRNPEEYKVIKTNSDRFRNKQRMMNKMSPDIIA